jgi:hypothetical protein
MKIAHTFSLTVAGLFLAGTVCLAQTPANSVGTQMSSTTPQSTVKKDGMTDQNQGGKKKKRNKDQTGSKMSNGQISEEKRLYRESSSSDGTAINNSNTTNYNSNNVTTAPTGAGSVPVPTTTSPKNTTQPN